MHESDDHRLPMDANPKRTAKDAGVVEQDAAAPSICIKPAAAATAGASSGKSVARKASTSSKPAKRSAATPAAAADAPAAPRRLAAFDLKAWAGADAEPEVVAWLQAHLDSARQPKVYPGRREYTFLGDPMSKVRLVMWGSLQ